MTMTFRQTYEKNVLVTNLAELLPLLVESSLPRDCAKKGITIKDFNPSSNNDSGGPLGTLGAPGVIFTTSKVKRKRETDNGMKVGIKRQKRSRSSFQNSAGIDDFSRDKRSTSNDDDISQSAEKLSSSRQKRFLNGFPPVTGGMFDTLPADPAAPPREVTEGEIMMKNLLMFSRLQKARLASEYGGPGRTAGGLNADKPSIGGGMFGDSYHGRKKRATANHKRMGSANLSRTKRFLFPFADPEGPTAGPDMFSLMTGTATDPNTGKRIEFGGDAMNNIMVNSYLSTLPFSAQPPPGKEPGEFVKNMAPLWYYSRMQRLMSPVPSLIRFRENNVPRKSSNDQKRNLDGYYGDQLPGKKRRRRAAVPYEGEVITVGEVVIPIDLFKGREKALALMMKTSTKQPTYGKGFYGEALTSPAKVPSKEVMALFRQLLRQNQSLRNRLKFSQQGWDVTPQSPPRNFGFLPGDWNSPMNTHRIYANQSYPIKTDYVPPQPKALSLYDPFFQNPLAPTPPTVYANRPGPYPLVPPTEAILYAPITPRHPVDPFILIPTTKDNLDPFQQSLDPFIPNPTTPPPTTTVTPLPPTAEPGRRKRSAEDDVSASEEDHARSRSKRSEKNDGGDTIASGPFFPTYLSNDGPNTAPHISSQGTSARNLYSNPSYLSPAFLLPGSHSGSFGIRPLYFSSENNFDFKPRYASPRGGYLYGDRLPWSSTAEHPARKTSTGSNSRFKRSDNENIDHYNYISSYTSPYFWSASPLTFTPYSAGSIPSAYRSNIGGVFYGDRYHSSAK